MPPMVFADTFYWLAMARPRDPWHAAVSLWTGMQPSITIVTTDEVLTEFLNAFAGAGPTGRAYAAITVHDVRSDARVTVLPQGRADFDAALALYEARPDKGYSLTDCRSMGALRALAISEVLTHDHHFAQEGFTILFP
ncbi:MAG: type II toxin-antitoxin system VapC family toxin [Gemmataceae bacterium]